jgi:phosphoribosylanthranilate isomerase
MGYHIRIKVCGVTEVVDVHEAANLGVDAIGLNFHGGSPRCVSVEKARELLAEMPPFLDAVGVFVKKSVGDLWTLASQLGRIHTIQIHGGPHEMVAAYPYHFIPAFSVREQSDLDAITRYLEMCRMMNRLPSAILVDGHAPGMHGGTGRLAPWRLLRGFAPGVPLILAGGLTPDNVASAIRTVQPWGVDVASGVESSPGQKDAELMRRFVESARAAARSL